MGKNVLQDWVQEQTFMQQSVLISAIRGADGIGKYHKYKNMMKWYRRCVLISAFDNETIDNPYDERGGSFTGNSIDRRELLPNFPWEAPMEKVVDDFMTSRDELPYHFTVHFMHAAEILGYKHTDLRIRKWWNMVYIRMVDSFHLYPESEEQMDLRLGDNMEQWLDRSDEAGSCSD